MNKKHKIWQSHIPGQPLGANVVKGDVGFAIRFWKRALKDAGTLQELKERRYFKKKSSKRREQMDNAKYFQKINSQQD
tara:strand:- start:111 stop:344 length:234 start_codon:yes stop_codon:yes gene_type:complete